MVTQQSVNLCRSAHVVGWKSTFIHSHTRSDAATQSGLLDVIKGCDVGNCIAGEHFLVLGMLLHSVNINDELPDHVGDLLGRVLHVVDLNVPRHRLQKGSESVYVLVVQ